MQIVPVIVPFFALVLIGYLAARRRVVPLESVAGLNTYVLYFALSAMLFQFGARTPVARLLDPSALGLWLVSGLVVLGAGTVTGLRGGRGWMNAAFGGLIAVLPNSGFMGLPLIGALRGSEATGPIVTTLLVDVVLIQSIAIALAHRDHAADSSLGAEVVSAARRVAMNPMPWAIVLGAVWGVTGWTMPRPIDSVLTMLAASATPVALFTIGAVLAREQMIADPAGPRRSLTGDVAWLTGLKLLAHPLAVWLLGRAMIGAGLPLTPTSLAVLVLVAALPSAANASMLAEKFGANNGRIASVILVSTVIGFVTFTLVAQVV